MNCRTARAQIHAQLDGTLADREPLQEHLDGCPACRQAMEEMARLCGAAANCAPPPEEEARLQRLTQRVLEAVHAPPRGARPAQRLWVPVASLAGMLLAFCLGYNLAPRSGPTASIAPAMQQVQAPAEPRVIVRERVVTHDVPVYRERVVYRDRVVIKIVHAPAAPTAAEWSEADEAAADTGQIADAPQTPDVAQATEAEVNLAAGTPPTPAVEKDDTQAIVVTLPASEGLPMATYSQSTRLARLTTDVAEE